ncbi:MAG: hypothetical protein QOF53_1140, partial [Nocardioidaceae bacterium]|nr:hypothetical protein [Nocardioidaceae bacterium]
LEVLHVDPDELVWASEIAERTGRTRQSVDQLIKAQRGPGGFPIPNLRGAHDTAPLRQALKQLLAS